MAHGARLEKLEKLDYDGDVEVEIALSAQMTKLSTGVTVWTNEADRVGTVGPRNVPAVVAEMNATMERAIEKLTPRTDRRRRSRETRCTRRSYLKLLKLHNRRIP